MKKVKLQKKFWVKGKSKFLELRTELQNKVNYKISEEEKKRQVEEVKANKLRRYLKYNN